MEPVRIQKGSRITPYLPPVCAAFVALLVSTQIPLLGPLLIALLIGAVVANTSLAQSPWLSAHAGATKAMLRWGVVLLGLKVSLAELAHLGLEGAAIVVGTVAMTFALTVVGGRVLRLDNSLVILIAAGFSICGAAAIAAASDRLRARRHDVALAIALVTVFGSLMIVVIPWLSRLFGLTDSQSAIWSGASIHEVAQVAAAASILAPGSLAVAMTIKLGRVVLLAPVLAVVSAQAGERRSRGVPVVPWFVAGFLFAVLVRSSGLLPSAVLAIGGGATTLLLAAAMFGLGLGIKIADLKNFPARAFVLAIHSTVVAAGTSLVLVRALG